ncbi:MAG TPA: Gfo/Idh/MocA family oxidoreductase [Kofleriaceae bacterium]|jgi:predicted dehydrogenase|nr:Gfo/Idh/MocA family oxidoreductase [Kofleriaceae bacterium]
MARTLGLGIVGCGNISTTYFALAPLFRGVEVKACADLVPAAAEARAKQHGVRAQTVDGLLDADDVDIVVNLTVPAAHHAVSRRALDAGKHVYSEKPFVLALEDGLDLKQRADPRGLRIGSAPDTFLGGAHQLGRAVIDTGKVGKITGGTCSVMSRGMEHWHPNPDFFFQPGAGPILDLGPYYVTNLIQLIGPVKRVVALGATPRTHRTITNGPRHGERVPVGTPTTIHAVMEFHSGALVTLAGSWDVWSHGHAPMELYGEDGTVFLPDPNFFGGDVRATQGATPVDARPDWDHPLGVPNQPRPNGMVANYRTAGLADMALSIVEGRPHRCSLDLALHTIDVLTGILTSCETGTPVAMQTRCERPAALGPEEARALLA